MTLACCVGECAESSASRHTISWTLLTLEPPPAPHFPPVLVFVLFMENHERGLFFSASLPVDVVLTSLARKYHGYLFSWATIYTFWYHPCEGSSGHLAGCVITCLPPPKRTRVTRPLTVSPLPLPHPASPLCLDCHPRLLSSSSSFLPFAGSLYS